MPFWNNDVKQSSNVLSTFLTFFRYVNKVIQVGSMNVIWSVNFLQIACFDSHLKCFFWKGPYEVEIWSEKRQFWHSLKIVNQASNWHVDYYIHVLVVVTSKNFENDQFYGSSEASFLENSPFWEYCEKLDFLKNDQF